MFWSSKATATTKKELPYLPDDVLLNCLARLSRSNYPNLSLVSKRFRSLIASKELYNTRSILGTTESYVYLSLQTESSSGSNPIFFTLREQPTRTSLNRFASRFFPRKKCMVSVPTLKLSPPPKEWVTTAIGSDIYMIGGCINDEPSSRVFVMDCLSHTWREAPSMLMAHINHLVGVKDGKIYVAELPMNVLPQQEVEVFDPKAQVWEYTPNQKNLHMFMENNINASSWSSFCKVDNVAYDCRHSAGNPEGKLSWWDSEGSSWRALKGCEHFRNFVKGCDTHVRLMNYGGKIAVFWMENLLYMPSEKERKIWHAEITIEKRNGQEIHGKFKYHGVVLRVPESSSFEQLVVSIV